MLFSILEESLDCGIGVVQRVIELGYIVILLGFSPHAAIFGVAVDEVEVVAHEVQYKEIVLRIGTDFYK